MLQQSLASLVHTYNTNKNGVCAVIGVPVEYIQYMPDTKSLMASAAQNDNCDFFLEEIVLYPGFEWFDFLKDFGMNISFGEDQKYTSQNDQFDYDIQLAWPNDTYAGRGLKLRAYDNREFVLIVKERTGAWRVIGSPQHGARLTTKFDSGTVNKGPSKYAGAFTWSAGNQRAFYTLPFAITDPDLFFSIDYDLTHQSFVKISIDEAVIIDWGDGSVITYFTPTGTNQVISHLYAGSLFATAKIYHRDLASAINVDGSGADWNFNITAITGPFPANLFLLSCKNNLCTYIDITDDTNPRLKSLDARTNHLPDTVTESILSAFDDLGASNGQVSIEGQAGTPPLTTGAAISKAHLVSRSWTITND